MSTTATTPALAPETTAADAPRGFSGLRCPPPSCGDVESVQKLHLDDLETLTCAACENEYALEDVRETLAAWGKVLAWVALAPALPE